MDYQEQTKLNALLRGVYQLLTGQQKILDMLVNPPEKGALHEEIAQLKLKSDSVKKALETEGLGPLGEFPPLV
jgi:hypothetical protein